MSAIATKESIYPSTFPFPQSDTLLDIITPHKLSVVFLIQEYLQVKRKMDEKLQPKYKRQFCMLLLKLIQYPDMSYKDLYQYLTSPAYGVVQQHLDGFEYWMKSLQQVGIEVLFDIQSLMDKLMSESANANGGVSQYGIIGLYLRRVHVTLDKMSFTEVISLYKNILTYYEKGVRSLIIQPDNNIDDDYAMQKQLFYKDRTGTYSKWSIKQSELFVAQQSALMLSSETDALNPIEMESKLKEIINDNQVYSQAHFLRYMNNLRIGDYQNALDALHRAFDRSMVKPSSTATVQDTKGFQYSSLNLAILHAHFNHKNEALASLKECIMLAQESKDRVCLQMAQSWLCYLDKTQIQLNDKIISYKLSMELSLVHSFSLGIQFVVKQAAQAGSLPSKLFELLLKSDILNCQHSMMGLIGNCIAEKAALYTLYGKNEIASLYSQLLLNSNLKALGKPNNCTGNCNALCCFAIWLSLQGEYLYSSIILEHAKERFPRLPSSKYWMICESLSNSIHSIYRQKWKEGSEAITTLFTLDESLGTIQIASLNIARGNLLHAREILQVFLSKQDLDHYNRVRGMILLSHTLILPQEISPHVINVLNKALHLSNEKYLDYESAVIKMIYSYVLLETNMPEQALKIIKEAIEIILSNGGIYDQAKCYFLLTKCLIASCCTNDEKQKQMATCLLILNKSIDYFIKLECYTKVKDVLCYISTFYNEMNCLKERNRYAYKFRKIHEQFPTSAEYLNIFY